MSLKHQADNFYLLILNSSVDLNDLKFFLTAGSPFAVTSKRKKERMQMSFKTCSICVRSGHVPREGLTTSESFDPSYMGLGGSWDE